MKVRDAKQMSKREREWRRLCKRRRERENAEGKLVLLDLLHKTEHAKIQGEGDPFIGSPHHMPDLLLSTTLLENAINDGKNTRAPPVAGELTGINTA